METHYNSQPALRDLRSFLAGARHDLMRSGSVAWRLFQSNLRARHRRAGLGYLWLVIPSLATTGVAVYLQSRGVIVVGPQHKMVVLLAREPREVAMLTCEGNQRPRFQCDCWREGASCSLG